MIPKLNKKDYKRNSKYDKQKNLLKYFKIIKNYFFCNILFGIGIKFGAAGANERSVFQNKMFHQNKKNEKFK